ncbi:MAG: DUF2975 domain-containing protein [Bacteroidia bacterium]
MKFSKTFSALLSYISRFFSVLYLGSSLYSMIILATETAAYRLKDGGKHFVINFPFSNSGFLAGENYARYKFEMVAAIGLYGVFLWMLANLFDTFRQAKLFTPKSVKRLTWFYIANFTIPPLFLILHIITQDELSSLILITFLHAVLGIFAYFMSVIFKQGLKLQSEQDLFI